MSTAAPQPPADPKTTQKLAARILLGIIITTIVFVGLFAWAVRTAAPDSAEIARPTQIVHPYDNKTCTVELTSDDTDQPPNRADITCGDEAQTLAGDFRDQITNRYNPETTDGITSIVAVGDERRVWIEHNDITCAIIWTEGDAPARCELTSPTG